MKVELSSMDVELLVRALDNYREANESELGWAEVRGYQDVVEGNMDTIDAIVELEGRIRKAI